MVLLVPVADDPARRIHGVNFEVATRDERGGASTYRTVIAPTSTEAVEQARAALPEGGQVLLIRRIGD